MVKRIYVSRWPPGVVTHAFETRPMPILDRTKLNLKLGSLLENTYYIQLINVPYENCLYGFTSEKDAAVFSLLTSDFSKRVLVWPMNTRVTVYEK